ncbi:MAG: DNA replication initiation complex subunit [Pyrobaculum sp.]
MIEKLRLWLQAEIDSKILAPPHFNSYAEVAEEFIKIFKSQPMPHNLQESVKESVAQLLISIIEIRTRKILWELTQGKEPTNLTEEEERWIRPIVKIRKARPHKKKIDDYVVVQFLMPYTTIVTEDFTQMGPFGRGDLAKLPMSDAKDLERKGVVQIVSL